MSNKKLNLNKGDIPKSNPTMSPEDAQIAMAKFYENLSNCLINLVAIQSDIAESLREISCDTSYLVENSNKRGLSDGWLTQVDIEEREKEDEPDEPANKG